MTAFQFDKCFNDKKVIEACNEEGIVTALPLERPLWDTKDPELLDVLMKRPSPMITTDRALPQRHSAHIPDSNPGIVVVAYSRYIDKTKQAFKTITTGAAGKILRAFKDLLPQWHQVVVSNSIVEITDKDIEIAHVEKGRLIRDNTFSYADHPNWQQEVLTILQTNAGRGQKGVLGVQSP